jgi:hypothetical protein
MNRKRSAIPACAVLALAFLTYSLAVAQQKIPSTLRQGGVVAVNETFIQGTVVSFTAHSAVAPLGAHVLVETSSGTVDVHLGKAALLKQANISLSPGDSVRIAGSNIAFGEGTIFAARMLVKGAQSVTLRNSRGIPLGSLASSAARPSAGGAR